jgi:hypothetical protein
VGIDVPVLPPYTADTAIALGSIIGVVMLGGVRGGWRFCLADIFMAGWCVCPLISALVNKQGAWEGMSASMDQSVVWGVPYVMARAVFATPAGPMILLRVVVVAALIYTPLCLWEMRMSPQLNKQIYGFAATRFHMNIRLGAYRPVVFLPHGVALGLYMAAASFAAIALFRARALPRCFGITPGPLVAALCGVALLCRAIGAIAVFGIVAGGAVMFLVRRITIGYTAIAVVLCVYLVLRATNAWYPQQLIDLAAMVSPERSVSLEGRLLPERSLVEHAMESPLFGHGGYGAARIRNEYGEIEGTVDSMWVIVLGKHGLFGLTLIYALLILIPWLAIRRASKRGHPRDSTAEVACASIVLMFAIDSMFNAFPSPIYAAMLGSIAAAPRMGLRAFGSTAGVVGAAPGPLEGV